MKNDTKEGFWDGLGFAIAILALTIGIGSCGRLVQKDAKPLFQPTIEIHLK